jgi:hypothetical protein
MIGNTLIVFSPFIASAYFILWNRSRYTVVAYSAASAWIIGCACMAIVTRVAIATPKEMVWLWIILNSIISESFRCAFVAVYRLVERRVNAMILQPAGTAPLLHDIPTALAAGLGYGALHSFTVISKFSYEESDGVHFHDQCSVPTEFYESLVSAIYFVIDVQLMLYAFYAIPCDLSQVNRPSIAIMFVMHSANSFLGVQFGFQHGCLLNLACLACSACVTQVLVTRIWPSLLAKKPQEDIAL